MIGLVMGNLKIAGIIAGIVALSVIYVLIRKSGADAARVKGMIDQLANVKARQDAENTVARADAAQRSELRRKWTKPKTGL